MAKKVVIQWGISYMTEVAFASNQDPFIKWSGKKEDALDLCNQGSAKVILDLIGKPEIKEVEGD